MSYQLVEDLQKKAVPATTVNQACRIPEVSRSGYYAAAKRRRAVPVVCAASVHLKAAFAASGRTYGSRGLRTALRARGLTISHYRVRSLMRANGLRSVWKRKFVHMVDVNYLDRSATTILAGLPNKKAANWLLLAALVWLGSIE